MGGADPVSSDCSQKAEAPKRDGSTEKTLGGLLFNQVFWGPTITISQRQIHVADSCCSFFCNWARC